jgi:hypothetical protein
MTFFCCNSSFVFFDKKKLQRKFAAAGRQPAAVMGKYSVKAAYGRRGLL